MIDFDGDARALFNLDDFGVPCIFGIYSAAVHYDAPGKYVSLGGPEVSSQSETIEFATSAFPGLTTGSIVTVDLTKMVENGSVTTFKVRGVTPQDDGLTSVAMLKRI